MDESIAKAIKTKVCMAFGMFGRGEKVKQRVNKLAK